MALLFEHAIEVENKTAHIYESFSKLFSHVPGLSDFWDGLVKDEKLHAATLEEAYKRLPSEQRSARADKKMWDNIAKNQRLLSRDLLKKIKTLDDAYELAHELEFSEVNVIFEFIIAESDLPSDRKKFIISEIIQHQKKLLDFNGNFGNKSWRQKIAIQPV